jgi:hypothetical protein
MVTRVSFLVDGFNIYHSLLDAGGKTSPTLKWLDLHALCRSHLYILGRDTTLEGVHYFSAYAEWRRLVDPQVVDCHKAYVRALESRGVAIHLGRFKEKDHHCPHCSKDFVGHEEKETDVAIAVKTLELFASDATDAVVLVTGDTDLVPAIKTVRHLYKDKRIWVAIPFRNPPVHLRHGKTGHVKPNFELQQFAHGHFKLTPEKYKKYQFPTPIVSSDGSELSKPTSW